MGKYMKKGRGLGEKMAVMEILQGQLGVRTRAMERKENNNIHSRKSESARPANSEPVQFSYLELRSRRLEKVVGCSRSGGGSGGHHAHHTGPAHSSRKAALSSECRKLSDLTNSDILADDCSSRLAHSEDTRLTRKPLGAPMGRGRSQTSDENRSFAYCIDEDPLHSSLRSSINAGLFHVNMRGGSSRGRAPPGVAHSRSNSRSNSITRECSRGILTRNQRKQEMQVLAGVEYMDVDSSSKRNGNSNSSRNNEIEVSFGEDPIDEAVSIRDSQASQCRIMRESTPSSQAREFEISQSAGGPQVSHGQTLAAPHGAHLNSMSPVEMEIEEFFSHAEREEQRRFIERYNFDPVSDQPLPGRFEWVSLRPNQ